MSDKMTIPPEAVEAAIETLSIKADHPDAWRRDVEAALEAAASFIRAQVIEECATEENAVRLVEFFASEIGLTALAVHLLRTDANKLKQVRDAIRALVKEP